MTVRRKVFGAGLAGLLAAAGLALLAPSSGPAGAAPIDGGARMADSCPNGYVGLTFDDGPNPSNTTTLLNTLRQNNVRATLFNTGQNAAANPSLVAAEAAAGMWIANHSYTHPHMLTLSAANMSSELSRTQSAIQAAGGGTPRIFRPPYGETNATLEAAASALGLRTVTWQVDSQDWNGASTAQIVQAASRLTDGQLILMHDQYATTIAAIPQIVAGLTSRGLCAGMISPTTGRAVAPTGTGTPTTPPPSGGSCTATYSEGQKWTDRFNGQVTVAGSNAWTVTVTVTSPQRIINTWNAAVSWDSTGNVMTARPNGSGNTFGFTIQHGGNWNWPALTCRA
ncbi:polysaccharide deacetylase family protein [Actinoplanes sp. RD1]|uniref:polysaccharide deacetylase family protein n=1 Tax=Actinoplanes sp. RD1 TaxID=3064538 RepID=UPI0027416EA8|nr:polysaccharide deacetylase family protein [Actinoplanes sp. RD1]